MSSLLMTTVLHFLIAQPKSILINPNTNRLNEMPARTLESMLAVKGKEIAAGIKVIIEIAFSLLFIFLMILIVNMLLYK